MSKSDRSAREGEAFVQMCAEAMGCSFIPGGDKLPSIDGQLQLLDPKTKTHLYIAVQVKTGPSYEVSRRRSERFVQLRLERDDILNWQSANIPVVIIWVRLDGEVRTALWADARRANYASGRLRVARSARFEQSSLNALLELARIQAGRPSVPRLTEHPICFANVREAKRQAWTYYRAWRHQGSVSPALGPVHITLKAWRHLTRVSMSQRAIVHKLSLLSCARQVVEMATTSQFLRVVVGATGPTELRALRGIYSSRFRADVFVEAIVQVSRGKTGATSAKLYSVQERRAR